MYALLNSHFRAAFLHLTGFKRVLNWFSLSSAVLGAGVGPNSAYGAVSSRSLTPFRRDAISEAPLGTAFDNDDKRARFPLRRVSSIMIDTTGTGTRTTSAGESGSSASFDFTATISTTKPSTPLADSNGFLTVPQHILWDSSSSQCSTLGTSMKERALKTWNVYKPS